MLQIQHDPKTLAAKRKLVTEGLMRESVNIKSNSIKRISNGDLWILFKYYDTIFLNNWFLEHFKGKFELALSKRMIRSAGMTKCPKNIATIKPELVVIQILMGVDFFFKFDQIAGSKNVCGLTTNNSLEALLIVFEHELCHALEFVNFGNSNCQAQRFKDIAHQLFGHTQSHHQLPTNQQIVHEKLGIKVGDEVHFIYENEKICGMVTNINKRATVMVKNPKGNFIDSKGCRFLKYYVPVNCLKK